MKHRISLVVAHSFPMRTIGAEGKVPWKLKADMERFVNLTTGHPVIMGRKTWESIDQKYRPLRNRTNIVVTREVGYEAHDAIVVNSLEAAYQAAYKSEGAEEVFGIGGGELYKLMIEDADRIYITLVFDTEKGDTYFPHYHEFRSVVEHGPFIEGSPSFFFLTVERPLPRD